MKGADTIAAPITGGTAAAVGIVRVSGPEALAIAKRLCVRWPEPLQPRRAFHSAFAWGGRTFDSGLVLPFPGPASYTGEDVVELQGHGGHAQRLLLEAAYQAGARPANPGEFTQRAYLAGRLDAVQAEAVALLIEAQTDRALEAAQACLGGALSAEIQELEDEVQLLRARVEGLLDFAAEAEGDEDGLREAIAACAARVEGLRGTYASSRRLFGRTEIVLAGPVNAGKSSLLNALVGEERALVDAEPGTTRDLVHADVELGGMPVRLVDTAGWREAGGVEARGIARGQAAAAAAELVLWVSDGSGGDAVPDPRWLAIRSKADLSPNVPTGWLGVSAKTGAGLDALRCRVITALHPGADEGRWVTTARQADALGRGATALVLAAGESMLELVAERLKDAGRALAAVRGVGQEGDVMEQVFARFCIGK